MSTTGLLLVAVGVVLVVVGLRRARGPWARYKELRAQDENIARYEAWRGGVRNDARTGASVAMAILRRQAAVGAGIAAAGGILVVVGLLVG
ncbi:MAG TPA: hypothetical protein VNO86_00325 [Candidatus Binatia bacterium]|nr:hypothetical protein [Candidatus Binatia bacterium]